jgi:hypothetical protein
MGFFIAGFEVFGYSNRRFVNPRQICSWCVWRHPGLTLAKDLAKVANSPSNGWTSIPTKPRRNVFS